MERTERGKLRYEQSLWYAWGREDAGDVRLRDSSSYHVQPFSFADFAADEADRFDREDSTSLSNIADQYERYVMAVTVGSVFLNEFVGDVYRVDAYLPVSNTTFVTVIDGPHGAPSTAPIGSRVSFTPNVLAGYRLVASGLGQLVSSS